MSSRDDWDAAFHASLEQGRNEERQRELATACILGRVSMLHALRRAADEGLSIDQFISVMKHVLRLESNTGKLDETTFKIPDTTSELDDLFT